jgi:hypothetical protein
MWIAGPHPSCLAAHSPASLVQDHSSVFSTSLHNKLCCQVQRYITGWYLVLILKIQFKVQSTRSTRRHDHRAVLIQRTRTTEDIIQSSKYKLCLFRLAKNILLRSDTQCCTCTCHFIAQYHTQNYARLISNHNIMTKVLTLYMTAWTIASSNHHQIENPIFTHQNKLHIGIMLLSDVFHFQSMTRLLNDVCQFLRIIIHKLRWIWEEFIMPGLRHKCFKLLVLQKAAWNRYNICLDQ